MYANEPLLLFSKNNFKRSQIVLGNDPTNTSIETNNQTVVLGNTLIRYVLLSNGYTATQITKVCMRPQLSVHVLNVSSWKKRFISNQLVFCLG